MGNFRSHEWEDGYQTYSPDQIEAVLERCRIEIDSETDTHFICYCPFHTNTDSPAFEIDKYTGQWFCFNPACGESSNHLVKLLTRLTRMDELQANVFISKNKSTSGKSHADRVAEALAAPVEFKEYPQSNLDIFKSNLWKSRKALDYLKSRGFQKETVEFFDVGYSLPTEKRPYDLVVVPMHDPNGMPIGYVGRSPETDPELKRFKNSYRLQKTKTLWNFHRAKQHGETVIVVEAVFDAMRVHEAGYPNVVATLGSHFSKHQAELLGRTFSKIILMTDYDTDLITKINCRVCGYGQCVGHRPGRDLARQIVSRLPSKRFMWAAYDDSCIYPDGAKDATDMTPKQVVQCLQNAVSNMSYTLWNIEGLAS